MLYLYYSYCDTVCFDRCLNRGCGNALIYQINKIMMTRFFYSISTYYYTSVHFNKIFCNLLILLLSYNNMHMNILRQSQIQCHVDNPWIWFWYDDNHGPPPDFGFTPLQRADGRGEGCRQYDLRDARRPPFRSRQQLQPVASSKGR